MELYEKDVEEWKKRRDEVIEKNKKLLKENAL
jgi:hypothetical protein